MNTFIRLLFNDFLSIFLPTVDSYTQRQKIAMIQI